MDNVEVKKLTNKILAQKGLPQVKNFAAEFSDGSKLIYAHSNTY